VILAVELPAEESPDGLFILEIKYEAEAKKKEQTQPKHPSTKQYREKAPQNMVARQGLLHFRLVGDKVTHGKLT
jgi:hypothetical protein